MVKKIFAPERDTFLTSAALLVLRVWLGLTMLFHHGLGKLTGFSHLAPDFPDPLGVGRTASLALAVFAEFFASLLILFGLVTRFGALVLAINMSVACFIVLKSVLSNSNAELAFLYLAGYVTLLIAGPGRVSADRLLFSK